MSRCFPFPDPETGGSLLVIAGPLWYSRIMKSVYREAGRAIQGAWKTARRIAALLAAAAVMAACVTGPINIPGDLSPAELIQRAQESSDRNRYKVALQYYEALLDRNRTNIDLVCTAEYEIAFIHYKQKKYDEAKRELTTLLIRYESPDQELLPQQFKRLANIVLEQIAKKETKRKILGFIYI
jgi:tetratricopeptide (TPR) repeat protein